MGLLPKRKQTEKLPSCTEEVLKMSRPNNSNIISIEFFDNRKSSMVFCKTCQKRLKTYRKIRYHYEKHHDLTPGQFNKISKIGRLLEYKE